MQLARITVGLGVFIIAIGGACKTKEPPKGQLLGAGCGDTSECASGLLCIGGTCTPPANDAGPPPPPPGPPPPPPPLDGGADGALDGGRTVADLSNVVLWLDAAQGITKDAADNVSAWTDQSPAKNDASQGTLGFEPTWVASVVNGHPALHANIDKSLSITPSASLAFGTGDFAIAAVIRASAADGPIYSCLAGAAGPPTGVSFSFFPSDGAKTNVIGVQLFAGVAAVAPITTTTQNLADSTARVVTVRRVGMTVELRLRGAVDTTSTAPANGADLSSQPLGAYTIKLLGLDGDLAEIIATKGALSDGDLGVVEDYLIGKYGL